ncbi:MAG: carboxypeptidase-like regulatory domain-containing protein [Planctomycetota bacterium]
MDRLLLGLLVGTVLGAGGYALIGRSGEGDAVIAPREDEPSAFEERERTTAPRRVADETVPLPAPSETEVRDLRAALERIEVPEIPRFEGRIEGRVTDAGGDPLSDVDITLHPAKWERPGPAPSADDPIEVWIAKTYRREIHQRGLVVVTRTGRDGRYEATGLDPDAEYRPTAEKDGWILTPTLEGWGSIAPGGECDFSAVRAGRLRLELVYADGSVPTSAGVSITTATGRHNTFWTPREPEVDAPIGPARVQVSPRPSGRSEEVAVEIEETLTEVRIVVEALSSIRGRVKVSGLRPEVVSLRALRVVPGEVITPEALASRGLRDAAYASRGFTFEFRGLPPGRYLVGLSGREDEPPTVTEFVDVGIEPASRDLVFPGVDREAYIRLVPLTPTGSPIHDMRTLGVTTSMSRESIRHGDRPQLLRDEEGRIFFRFPEGDGPDVEGNECSVRITCTTYGSINLPVPRGTRVLEARFATPAEILVELRGASPEIRSEVTVAAIAQEGWSGRAERTEDGMIRVSGVQPGPATLVANLQRPRQRLRLELARHDVEVRSGENRIALDLTSMHDLTVTVEGGDERSRVEILREGRRRDHRSEFCDARGRVTFSDLLAGKHRISVRHPGVRFDPVEIDLIDDRTIVVRPRE